MGNTHRMKLHPQTGALLTKAHHEGSLLLRSLEAAVAKLGSGVDKLQFDLFPVLATEADAQRLREEGRYIHTSHDRIPT